MKRRNVIAADLRSPKYQKKVVRDRTKYTRKSKHKLILKPRLPSRDFGLLGDFSSCPFVFTKEAFNGIEGRLCSHHRIFS